jgi:hypothetical protein
LVSVATQWLRQVSHYFWCIVSGTIIYYDQFVIGKVLRLNRGYCPWQAMGVIVSWDDNSKKGVLFHLENYYKYQLVLIDKP